MALFNRKFYKGANSLDTNICSCDLLLLHFLDFVVPKGF